MSDRETIWTEARKPGDIALREVPYPGARPDPTDPDHAVIIGRFIDSSWFSVPPETPAPDGGKHPCAGRMVRVTRRFFGPNPHTGSGRVAHLWSAEAGLGVAECPEGFTCYLIDSWPPEVRVEDVGRVPPIEVFGVDNGEGSTFGNPYSDPASRWSEE